jgi:enamine deaminase RidA (YjgF/YER057c/UK114 family)
MVRRALEPNDYPFFDYRRFTFSLGVAAEGQVWLSGSTAVRFDPASNTMVVEGDLIAQATVIYDKMAKTLWADGLELRHVNRMTQYVTPDAVGGLTQLDTYRKSVFGAAAPVVNTIIVKGLLREAALIEIEATASDQPRRPVTLVASAEGDPAHGDITAQCRDAYTRLGCLLDSAGAGLGSIVKTTEFILPAAVPNYRGTADVRRELFAKPYPSATGVICETLAQPGSQILVEAIAVRKA